MTLKNLSALLLLLVNSLLIFAQPKLDVDIITGSISSNPKYYTEFKSKLYFQGYDGKNGRELWEYDGKSTPSMTANIHTGSNSNSSNPAEFCVFNDKLYFSATEGSDGYELWEYDGKNSPKQVKDIYSGYLSSLPNHLIVYKGKLYFEAQDSAHGYEMWSVDSSNNVSLVADINKGTSGSYAQQFIIFNDTLFFQANDGSNGNELWAYTGSGSPFMIANIASGSNYSLPGYFSIMNGCLYFSAQATSTVGRELYKYSSKTGQVTLVSDIWSGSSSSNPNQLYTYNGQLYFQAIVTGYGYELMTCNSKDSVWRVADIRSGSGSGNPMDFYEYDSKMYFRATDGKAGEELWVYDGKNSPSLVLDIDSGAGSSYPVYFTEFNNNLYFTADDGSHGSEIWIIENCPSSSKSVDTVKKCNSYKWIDGKTYTSSTTSPFVKYTNKQGCDSVISLDLTIYKTDYVTDSIEACVSYKWVNGKTYTKSNYSDTILYQNRYGCDSIVYLNLTIHQPTQGVDSIVACDSAKWIDGITYFKTTNTPKFTLKNQWGCDSVVSLNLIVNQTKHSTDKITACSSYKWIDGNTYTQSTSKPLATLTAHSGCDSIVKLDLTILKSTNSIDKQIACESFTWRNGNTYTKTTNTPYVKLTNAAGCDSIIYLNLTILNKTQSSVKKTACDSFKWIDGNTYTQSGTHNFLTKNFLGCDSLINLDLTINNSTKGTDVRTECNSYKWIDGITYTQSTTKPTFTIQNYLGCDSLVSLSLTIIEPSYGIDKIESCNPIKWIDGKSYSNSTNTPRYTIKNHLGCDSIITLNFILRTASYGEDIQNSCDKYKWIDGITYTESTDTPKVKLTNQYGCDSFVTLKLTINKSTNGTDTAESCGSYTWIDGITYTNSTKTPTFLIKNQIGCDSTIHLDLNILPMPSIDITYNGNQLQSKQYNATYQWLDCGKNLSPIAGANSRTYGPKINGSYALDVTLNQCRDTSTCIQVSNLFIDELITQNILYPNPTTGNVKCNLTNIQSIEVYSINGKKITEITEFTSNSNTTTFNTGNLNPALYLIRITTGNGFIWSKLTLNNK